MCFVRTLRTGSLWVPRRYIPFLLVAVAILLSQGFLAYFLYGLPESSRYSHESLRTGLDLKGPISNIEKRTAVNRPRRVKATTPLPFAPPCVINNTDVFSAIRRAKTLECKKQFADLHCKELMDELYPARLHSTCPLHGDSEFVGCFRNSSPDLLHLPYYIANVSLKNQPPPLYGDAPSCINACFGIGSPFAVFNDSLGQCRCSNTSLDTWNRDGNCEKCSNCDEVHKTGLPLEPTKNQPVTDTPPDSGRARIVFFLTVNGRSVRQIQRLINALRNTSKINHYFYVHVDERQDYLYRSMKALEHPSWMVVSQKRFSTIWGGATLLQMLLASFETLLSMTDWKWDYVINLSETDFPLKRVEVLEKFLYANLGQNFVRSHGQETARFISKQALKKTFHECEMRMWKLGDRDLPAGLRYDGGSDWVSLHRDFVDWLIKNRYSDLMLLGLEDLYRQTLLPAESYFHTVLQNSVHCTKFIDNNLRFVNWRRKQGCKCQYKHIVDWCGCSPNVFLEDDHDKLVSLQKKPIFFGRKFEPVISQSILDSVEREIGIKHKNSGYLSSLYSYWQNEYNYLDRSPPVDQGRLSAWASLARLALQHIGNLGQHCVLRNAKVIEVWSFFRDDNFEGVVIQFEAQAEHIPEPVRSEVWFRRKYLFETSGRFENDRFADRLAYVEVSTDFDLKELLSRNFAGLIGPYSEPGVIQHWNAGPEGAVTFVWIDPAKVVAGSYEIHISRSEQIQHHKPPLGKPLRPGNWELKVYKDWVLMGEIPFLVHPQTFHNNVRIRNETVSQVVNGGPENGYTDTDLTAVEKFLGFKEVDINDLIKKADAKSRWTAAKLEEWADILTSDKWGLEELCFIPNPLHMTGGVFCPHLPFEACNFSQWSSVYPDLKIDL